MTVADQLKKWAKGRDSAPAAKKPINAKEKESTGEYGDDEGDDTKAKDEPKVTAGSKSPLKNENPLEAYKRKFAMKGKG